MTEIRHDPLRRRRILVAEQRAGRPNEYRAAGVEGAPPIVCPFCPGNERETPPELAADRPEDSRPDDPAWTLRVVPNRYPAVRSDAPDPDASQRAFFATPARGRHEVIVETREHGARLETMPQAQVVRFLHHVRERVRSHAARGDVAEVLVFRNCGPGSGASLSHPHTQLVALSELSTDRAQESERARVHREATGRCATCDLVQEELADGRRVVRRDGELVAFVPYSARYGAEYWITASAHPGDFTAVADSALPRIAKLLQWTLRRLIEEFSDPSYNLIVPAWERGSGDRGHFRIEVVPRLANVGGFELATGDFIVSRAPERVANLLRRDRPGEVR